ncbi:hypothetical protein ACQE32_17165 [Pantoea sp. FN0302]
MARFEQNKRLTMSSTFKI